MKKKLIALISGVSMLMASSVCAYANNTETSANSNNIYTRTNYAIEENQYNLIDVTFNKHIVSILNKNCDFYNIYKYKAQMPLLNINLIMKNSLLENNGTLNILSNVSNISLATETHLPTLLSSRAIEPRGSRLANFWYRELVEYGAIVESKGEPAQMLVNGSAGQFRFWSYNGYWNGSEYYRPKELIFDTLKSQSFDNTYTGTVTFNAYSNMTSNIRVYVSNDKSSWREVLNGGNVTGTSYISKTINFTPSSWGTFRYIKVKLDNFNGQYGSTIDLVQIKINQVDNTPPTGNAPKIIASDENSFTVEVTGLKDDISGVSMVRFPTWTTHNGQDDIKWYAGTNHGNGRWTYTVNRKDHNNEFGEYVTHVFAYDADWAGNSRNLGEVKHTFVPPPTVTHTISPSTWTNQDVTIKLTAQTNNGLKHITLPNGSTTTSGTVSYKVSENGTYTFKATDNSGNVTTYNVEVTNIDKTPPVINNIPDNNSVFSRKATFNLSATDSGGSGMEYIRIDKGGSTLATGTNSVSYTENSMGRFTFVVLAKDKAGNLTQKNFTCTIADTPVVDKVTVTGYDFQNPNNLNEYWVRPNIDDILKIKTKSYFPFSYKIYPEETQLALVKDKYSSTASSTAWATKSGTGSKGTEFDSNFILTNGTKKAFSSKTTEKYILQFTHSLTALLDNQDYKIYSGARYNTLQSAYVDSGITIRTDGTAPTITLNPYNAEWTDTNIKVNISVTDSRSGVKNWQVRSKLDNGAWSSTTNNVSSITFTQEGIHTLEVTATDNVGNTITKTATYKIDKTAPTINNIPANNSIFGGSAALNLSATDSGGSGMKKITLYKNNTVVATGTSSLSYTEDTVGASTFKVVAEDNAGNTTEKTFTLTVVKKPNIDNLSVVKYDYKESDTIYWVRPNVNGVLQIKTQAYFPSSYGIYPTETQLGLGKLNYTSGTSSLAWATTSGTGSSGSEFATNFTLSNGSNKATTSSSGDKNLLTFTHTLTPKLDNADYRLYSSGKYNNEQADFVNSSILIKTDGTAPTIKETSAIPTGWTNKDVTITFTSSDSRSGVKNNQIKYTGTNTAPTEVTLNNANTITFTNTDYYSVTLLSTDNVGNVSKKTGSFGIDKIKPVIGTIPSNGTEYLDMTTLNIKSTDDGGSLMKSLTLHRNGVKIAEGVDSVSYFENVNGTHTFKVVAEDNAGNITEKVFTITILEDSIDLITIPNNPKNLIRLEWNHLNLLNKSYTVYQKREDESVFSVVPGTGDTFTKRVLDNTYANDITPPDIPNVSFIEETDIDVKYKILPTEDNGTTYEFYVVSKDNYGKLTKSNIATDTVKTGLKGYTYVVDGNTNTIPDKTVDVTVAVSEIVAPIQANFDHYLHIAAIDNAGNMGPVNHIKIWEAVEDNWFNQEIAKQVGKDYSEIRISDYRSIEVMTLRNKGIVGEIPKDIKKTINLLELDLYRNSIDDISNLTGLTKLEYLQLGNNQISDISTLTGLTELTDLNIYNNKVSDISVVSQMPNLERLYIHKNNITDISAVENLNKLEELYFELNYIDLNNPTTIRIIEKFENKGCYVVSSPQNIVRANENDIVELNIGDEFIPKTILGLSENNIDIIGEYSILRTSEVNYLSSDKNIVDVQNNKLVALSEGEVTITVVHKQFRSVATVSFIVNVMDPNKAITKNTNNNIEDIKISEDIYLEDNNDVLDDTFIETSITVEEDISATNESEPIIDNESNEEEKYELVPNNLDSKDSSDMDPSVLE